jgi:hypothetical protein
VRGNRGDAEETAGQQQGGRNAAVALSVPPVVDVASDWCRNVSYVAVGWTVGRKSHAVLRAESPGTLHLACLHMAVAPRTELSQNPKVERVCRHHNCLEQLQAWLADRRLPAEGPNDRGRPPT